MNNLTLPMEVGHLLPQKPPVVMVDTLLECTGTSVKSRFNIQPDNLFVQNGVLREEGLLENIAQTAAAQVAVLGAPGNGRTDATGFIGAISRVDVQHFPAAGSIIETTLVILHQIQNVTIIEGTAWQDGRKLATCEMKIFLKPDA